MIKQEKTIIQSLTLSTLRDEDQLRIDNVKLVTF